MRNALAKWYISRAIDEGREVPAWVRRRLQRDARLADYARRSRVLVSRLSDEAAEWIEASGESTATSSGSQPRVMRANSLRPAIAVTLALAATVLIVLSMPGPPPRERTVAVSETQQEDIERVKDFLTVQASFLKRSWSRVSGVVAKVPSLGPRQLTAADWLSDRTNDAVVSSGRVAGRTLDALRDGVTQQRDVVLNAVTSMADALRRPPGPGDMP